MFQQAIIVFIRHNRYIVIASFIDSSHVLFRLGNTKMYAKPDEINPNCFLKCIIPKIEAVNGAKGCISELFQPNVSEQRQ